MTLMVFQNKDIKVWFLLDIDEGNEQVLISLGVNSHLIPNPGREIVKHCYSRLGLFRNREITL